MQSFPSYVPCAIMWKAWVVEVGASVPASTHHGDGGEEGTIAGEVGTQAVCGLEVMT